MADVIPWYEAAQLIWVLEVPCKISSFVLRFVRLCLVDTYELMGALNWWLGGWSGGLLCG